MKAYPKSFLGWFWTILVLLTLSGLALLPGMLALRFELDVSDEWLPGSRVLWASLHGLLAFCTLLLLGGLLPLHVRHGLHQRRNRGTGILLLAILPALILTGWGIYYLADELLSRWVSAVHTAIAVVVAIVIGVHAWRAHRIHAEFGSRHLR